MRQFREGRGWNVRPEKTGAYGDGANVITGVCPAFGTLGQFRNQQVPGSNPGVGSKG